MEQILKEHCPRCQAVNYVSNGDTSDLTVPDVDAVRCHACGEVFLLEGWEEIACLGNEPWVLDGKPSMPRTVLSSPAAPESRFHKGPALRRFQPTVLAFGAHAWTERYGFYGISTGLSILPSS